MLFSNNYRIKWWFSKYPQNRSCQMMMNKYAIHDCSLPHSFFGLTAQQFRWLHCCSFCLNIKSWRTTITLDSSIIILHLPHKSECGGTALAMCLKLLAELMCQLKLFSVVTRSKKSEYQAREGWFLFLVQPVAILQMHIWKPGSVAGVTQMSSQASSKLALGHQQGQRENILLAQSTSSLSIQNSVTRYIVLIMCPVTCSCSSPLLSSPIAPTA